MPIRYARIHPLKTKTDRIRVTLCHNALLTQIFVMQITHPQDVGFSVKAVMAILD